MTGWETWLIVPAALCGATLVVSLAARGGPDTRPGDPEPRPSVTEESYGKLPDGREAHLYTLTNAKGMRVRLTDYGAILVGVEAPDRQGRLTDVTLGCDDLPGWLKNGGYFGATVGRYANRIAKARFTLDGTTYTLAANNGPNHLHGGRKGFNRVLWRAESVREAGAVGVRMTYLSKDGEEGYPGNLNVEVLYRLTNDNEVDITFIATTDAPTIVNLAHHSYWNLAGPAAGDVLGHELTIFADSYTPVDPQLIPTGRIAAVRGTPFDFTKPARIGARIAEVKGGYDHNYVLRGEAGKVRLAARVYEPGSGRVMDIHTDQPGVQFYSGNFLGGGKGKGGLAYGKHYGFCLETQLYPDSPNQPGFPSPVLRPGQTYRHRMIHKFSVK